MIFVDRQFSPLKKTRKKRKKKRKKKGELARPDLTQSKYSH